MELTKLNTSDFRVCELVLDSDGAKVTADDIELRIFEVIEAGTYKLYDWNDDTFKSTAATTQHNDCSHKTVDNSTYNTGIFENDTNIDKDAFTAGRTYIFEFYNDTDSELISQTRVVWGDYGPLAITGADGDTLETLSDQIDGTSTFDNATDEVDVGEVKGSAVTGVDDFKADVSGLSVFDADTDEVDIGAVKGSGVTGVDDFMADVSNLSSQGSVDTIDSIVDAIKAVTDLFNFTGDDVKATLDGEKVTVSGMDASVITSIVTGVWAKVMDGTKTAADIMQLVNAVFRGDWSYNATTSILIITNEDAATEVQWDFSVTDERTTV